MTRVQEVGSRLTSLTSVIRNQLSSLANDVRLEEHVVDAFDNVPSDDTSELKHFWCSGAISQPSAHHDFMSKQYAARVRYLAEGMAPRYYWPFIGVSL